MEKQFDVHGWNYDDAEVRLREFIASVIDGRNAFGYRTWRAEDVSRVEGKAFGLTLCEILAQGSRFIIPPWFTAESLETLEEPWTKRWLESHEDKTRSFMVRSSSRVEDWIDPLSGVGQSKWCGSQYLRKELAEHFATSEESVVVQKHAWGCGCVIDVGYSELLGRPIIRIAQGNQNFINGHDQNFTSATWDHESHVGIFDAESGEHLSGSKLGFKVGNPFPELVKELIKMLDCASLNFGLQIEVIVDPYVSLWHLVQIRPSPASVRGMKERPEISGKLFSTTGKVNKAGTASGELVADRPYSEERLHYQAQELSRGWRAEGFDLTGKVVLWDYASLKYNAAQTIHGAGLAGAEAQITGHSLFTNSGHGTYSPYSDKGLELKAWEEGRNLGLQFGRIGDMSMVSRLQAAVRKETIKLLLVSDGLVGQIYQQD